MSRHRALACARSARRLGALPPAWTDTLLGAADRRGVGSGRVAGSVAAGGHRHPERPRPRGAIALVVDAASPARRTARLALLQDASGAAAWSARRRAAPRAGAARCSRSTGARAHADRDLAARPRHRQRDVWTGGPARVSLEPGRAEVLGADLRWSRFAWQAGDGERADAGSMRRRARRHAVAPLLRRLQPDFGWGGDLTIGGHARRRERADGQRRHRHRTQGRRPDRHRRDRTQALGLTDLRLGLAAQTASGTSRRRSPARRSASPPARSSRARRRGDLAAADDADRGRRRAAGRRSRHLGPVAAAGLAPRRRAAPQRQLRRALRRARVHRRPERHAHRGAQLPAGRRRPRRRRRDPAAGRQRAHRALHRARRRRQL